MIHKADVLFYSCFAFLCGVGLASFIEFSSLVSYVLFLLGTVIFGLSVYQPIFEKSKDPARNRARGALIGFLILLFAFGGLRFAIVDQYESRLAEFADRSVGQNGAKLVNPDFNFVGYIQNDPETREARQQFIFRVKRIDVPGRSVFIDEPVLVTADLYPKVNFGDELNLTGQLAAPFSTPEFDYASYLKRDGIRYIISFAQISEPAQSIDYSWTDQLRLMLYGPVFRLKEAFTGALTKSVSEPQASYLNGVLTGERAGLSNDLRTAFNRTSTSHILAISGYNIALIAGGLLWALTWFMVRRRAFWVSIVIIIAFTILTGASASVVRASIMGLMLLGAQGYGRLYDSRNAMVLSAVVMVVISPHILRFDGGFQLSFLALIGIVYLYPIFDQRLKSLKLPKGLKELGLMTVAAQVAVLPLLIYYFDQFSLVALPVNLLILPLVPSAMLTGFVAGLAGLITPLLGRIVGLAAWSISSFQLAVVQYASSLNWASIKIEIHPLTLLGLYILLFIYIRRHYHESI